jgi:hypothetical protein
VIDLERHLTELGDLLDLPVTRADGSDLASQVLARIPSASATRRASRGWRVAVAVLLVVGVVVAVVPASRDAVSGWLGLDRVTIERRDDLRPPQAPVEVPTEPGIDGEPVVVDGRTVRVGVIDGLLSDVMITKSVESGAPVRAIDIDGAPALWVEAPHEVLIEVDGEPVVERVAASTLLWQDGDVLRRVEGFATLDEAVAFARSR